MLVCCLTQPTPRPDVETDRTVVVRYVQEWLVSVGNTGQEGVSLQVLFCGFVILIVIDFQSY